MPTRSRSTSVSCVACSRRSFPHWAALTLEPVLSAGTVNALYRLGEDMVVRLPRVEHGVGGVEHEHAWLPRLAPLLPVATPVLLGKGTRAEGYPWPWSVYRWLEGENPTPDRLRAPGLLAKDPAEFVAALHRIDPTGGPPAYRGGPLATRDSQLRTAVTDLHGVVDTDAATAAWEAALEEPEWPGPPGLGPLLLREVLAEQQPSACSDYSDRRDAENAAIVSEVLAAAKGSE